MEKFVKRKKYFSITVISLFLLFGCGQEEPAIKVDLSKKEQASLKEQSDVIIYVYLPDILSEQERGCVASFFKYRG